VAKVELERASFAELVKLAQESGIIKVEPDGRITMLDHPRKARHALLVRILSMPVYADRIRAHVSEAERELGNSPTVNVKENARKS
jgi:hypothetical protein